MSIFSLIKAKIFKLALSSEQYARHIGVNLGSDNFISGKDHWSTEPYLITIGSHCQITKGVLLLTHGGAQVARRKDPTFDVFGKIHIGDWVYIGANSMIMPGVSIGEQSLIAAGSVVTKSIPAGEVWAGVPARFICTIKDYIDHNRQFNVGTKLLSPEAKRRTLLSLPDSAFIRK